MRNRTQKTQAAEPGVIRCEIAAEELAAVVAGYDVGKLVQACPVQAGNARSPKLVLVTDQGRFLLKRRPPGHDEPRMVCFSHSVQNHLKHNDYPVAGLVPTRDEGKTAIRLNGHIYELFYFTHGGRCTGSTPEIMDAGRQLARFHRLVRGLESDWFPHRTTYHDAGSVRGYLRTIRANKRNELLQTAAEQLLVHYNHSSVSVNALGFDGWPNQVIHSDWHPGNLLFADERVQCVLDFDGVKIAPPVIDLANGMLQFSIVGVRPNPADWPAYLDQAKAAWFIEGYREIETPSEPQLRALPDLMIEIMIAEAVHPIAATGYFGHHSGLDFLQMIHRKCDWIEENREKLHEVIWR